MPKPSSIRCYSTDSDSATHRRWLTDCSFVFTIWRQCASPYTLIMLPTLNDISIGSAVYVGLTGVTNAHIHVRYV